MFLIRKNTHQNCSSMKNVMAFLIVVIFIPLLCCTAIEQKLNIEAPTSGTPSLKLTTEESNHSTQDEIYIDDEGLEGSGGRGEIHDDLEKELEYSGSGYGPDDEDSSITQGRGGSSSSTSTHHSTNTNQRKDQTHYNNNQDLGSGDGDDDNNDDDDDDVVDNDNDDDEDNIHAIGGVIVDNKNENVDDNDDDDDDDFTTEIKTNQNLDIDPSNTDDEDVDIGEPKVITDTKTRLESSPGGGSGGIDSSNTGIDLDLENTKQHGDTTATNKPATEHNPNSQYPNEVLIMNEDRTASFFAQPGILAAIIGGAVVGLLCAILVVMFIVYRMRKKDEGSYALDEPKRSPAVNSYAKNSNNREFYA